ncbi:histidine kinase [Oceanobacillus sp. CAU 1775]
MNNSKSQMDERILVCVYYGPNGERLIRRGHKLSQIMNCPVYVLTVDPLPYDEFDAEKSGYIDRWRDLCGELGVDEFIIRDDERRPSVKAIAEVAHTHNVTQIIVGQSPQNRWEEITKGSFVNSLLKEMTFVDIHIVSVDRSLRSNVDTTFEKGVRAFLKADGDNLRISFTRAKNNLYEGIFYKEIGTDFNNGIFRFVTIEGKTEEIHITDDLVVGIVDEKPNIRLEKVEK